LWERHRGAILFLLALLIFATAIAYAGYGLLAVQNQVEYGEINPPSSLVPPRGRMLVILLDSARKDFVFSDHMPFISSLRERGAWGISEVLSVPTTVAGSYAIFSGTVPNPFAIFEDFEASPSTVGNLFQRVTQGGGRAVIFSGFLRGVYGEYSDLKVFEPRRFLFSQYREEARYIYEQAYRFLKNEPWDLAVVTFYALDYLGHLETPRSPKYEPMLRLMDEYVRRLVEVTTDQDVVLITAEHGMDDLGFHADRPPIVIDTPFVLLGPLVKPGGPKKVLQIDWAPTLSILAGVSPFYESPALPALDLLNLSPEANNILLKEFSRVIKGPSGLVALNELREHRLPAMGRKGTPLTGLIVVLLTVLSMTLLAYVALLDGDYEWNGRSIVMLIGGGMVGLCSLISLIFYLGVIDYIFNHFPFRATFILAHLPHIALAFALIGLIAMQTVRVLGKQLASTTDGLLLFLFVLVFAGIFIADNPYDPLMWVVISIPLAAWGLSRRPVWLMAFGALIASLLIRRFTFFLARPPSTAIDRWLYWFGQAISTVTPHAGAPPEDSLTRLFQPLLPDRWILAAAVLALGLAFLWLRIRTDQMTTRTLAFGMVSFLLGIAVIAWPFTVEIRAILLSLFIFPVAVISWRDPKARDVWWALWVVFYYLGTSSNINLATHVAVFPLLLVVWSTARGTSAVARGVVVSFVIWAMFLMPGTGLGLRLAELSDKFFLSSAATDNIQVTVLVIASRYILPAAVLLWGMKWADSGTSTVQIVSTALLPAVCGIGVLLAILNSTTAVDLQWGRLGQLTVLFGYFVAVISAFLIVASVKSVTKLLWSQALAINHTLSRKV